MKCKNKNCKNQADYSCEGYCRNCFDDLSRIKQLNLDKFKKIEEK